LRAQTASIHRQLHRRGFWHCSITGSFTQFGRYSAALIAGDRSRQAQEASLAHVSPLLNATATIVVSIDSEQKGLSLRVRTRLEQLGFRIEADVRCQQAFLLSAYRCNVTSIAKAD
jgi:threonyl-tRNA synthetase